ncbi:MAG: hypothetical protein E7627_04900 [Ruminococcaceae bacterium]|nr:hypothetical protein [Oscillospiraceae bacterium]
MFRSKKIFTRTLAVIIICATVLSAAIIPLSAARYKTVRSYNDQFTDIKKSDWFYSNVADAYELGLINGKTDTTYVPDGNVTIAETIKLAAVVHRLLVSGGVEDSYFTARYPGSRNWYDPYVRYCTTNGIVTEAYPDYNAAASRAQVAVLFSRAITSSKTEIYDINTIQQYTIKDVPSSAWYISAIYKMYRWGIITGDGNGYINPESKVKRSEIAAIVIRIIDEDERVDFSAPAETDPTETEPVEPDAPLETDPEEIGPDETTPEEDPKEPEETYPPGTYDYPPRELYKGELEEQSFTGITAVGAEFTNKFDEPTLNTSYSIDLINDVMLDENYISFNLYEGYGFEALGIIRGWLGDAAVGIDGKAVRSANEVYTRINELFYIWIDGDRYLISELWYTDHGEYTTYEFYFEEKIGFIFGITELEFMFGKVSADAARGYGLDIIADRIENAGKETPPPSGEDVSTPVYDEQAYKAAIEDAKYNAITIIFEYECDRCTILYGRGLYGGYNSDYRLILIFRDGSPLVVSKERLNKVRINDEGTILYYTVDAPDGMEIQYGINLKLQ